MPSRGPRAYSKHPAKEASVRDVQPVGNEQESNSLMAEEELALSKSMNKSVRLCIGEYLPVTDLPRWRDAPESRQASMLQMRK